MSARSGKRAKRRFKHGREAPGRASPAAPGQPSTKVSALLAAAAQSHQAGRLAEAEALYRQILELDPRHTEGLHNFGVLVRQTGRYSLAEDLIRKAISLNGRVANFHQSLGDTVEAQGKLAEAVGCYRRAIQLRPDFIRAHYNLAVALGAQGILEEAAASYRRTIALKADFPEAHNNLGAILKSQGKLDEAAASWRRALDLKPDFAEVHSNLGALLQTQGRLNEAATACRRAIALKPDFAEAYNNLGNVLIRQGRVAEAVTCLKRAAQLATGRSDIWFNLGRALAVVGDLEPARAAMLRAVQLDPHSADAIYAVVGLQPMDDGSPGAEAAFAAVRGLADDVGRLAPEKRPPALFAMAKALESRGDFDNAFAFMARANATVRAGLTFDIAEDERRMATFARIFDDPFLRQHEGVGSASERPILIFGMARSGTTLIEQVLSAHPAVRAGGELANLNQAIAALTHGGSTFSAWTRTLSGADCRALAQAYLDSLPPALPGQTRITDKGLGNFEHLGLIHLCLPNARIIHCFRDPRDVCLSAYATLFRDGHRHAFDLVDLGRFWRAYDRLMAHWRAVLPDGCMFEAPYEAVVGDLEAWARRLITYCGLDWDDACLHFHESKREILTASLAQVRQPIYATSIGRWRRFARHLGPLLETLGEPWSNVGFVGAK